MLIQIHHQFSNEKTEFCAQREVHNFKEKIKFMDEIKISHPLPKGAYYRMYYEASPHFIMTKKEDNGE